MGAAKIDDPQQVYICPACQNYAPADAVDDAKPVCSTDGCEREGDILNLVWMCPACEKCFGTQDELRQHGKQAHDM
jgi:hypothetical protein